MKIFIFAVISLLGVLTGFSQGQINFLNTSGALGGPARPVFTTHSHLPDGTLLTGTNYAAELVLASDFSVVIEGDPAPFRISTTTQPGTWNGGVRNFIPIYQPGDTLNLVVRVWDTSLFSTWDQAWNSTGIAGISAPFSYLIPAIGTPPSGLAMNNFQSFAVSGIPEPSTLTLGLLSLVAMGLMHRRKTTKRFDSSV